MTQHDIFSSLTVFDYDDNKLCDLYDSQNDLTGQAYGISFTRSIQDGVKSLNFKIPYMVDAEKNFRWQYLKSEYLIRLIYNGSTEWYIAQKPVKHREKGAIYGDVTCAGIEASLKTKNIYMEFDDENGIGTVSQLADKILAGTGWHRGHTDPMLEADGTTEKIRSITSGGKQGALGLMTTLCNLFRCYPVYKSDTKSVELYNYNNRDQVLEGTIGVNLDALSVTPNSADIITRLYVEGEYGEDGYIGIDSVNPTGLNYIMNFDYYREIGVFTATHEAALSTYLTDIADKKADIMTTTSKLIAAQDEANGYIGQCKVALYFTSSGFTTPFYVYGDLTATQKALNVGDNVVVLKNDNTFRYATIETTAAALIQTGEYGIAKFATKAAGTIGALEVQIEAKEKEIENLQAKIAASTGKPDKIAEYNAEITALQADIQTIYTQENGLYAQMTAVMKSTGTFYKLDKYEEQGAILQAEQDEIESTFIVAMGDMLRDGYWNDKNYVEGQEQHLYDDAVERLAILSRPSFAYSFSLIRLHKEFGIPLEDFKLNAIFRIHDDELDVNENLFVTKITIGVDDESSGSIDVSNKDITLNSNDLGALLSRMSQLADLIEQKQTLYERAKAISSSGTIYTERLNGQIDVLKTQLLSTVSNWHTDEQGNIMFESVDGGSAMMLCGAGFMIANSKDNNGDWNWRTFGTGEGFTADEIVAGFISAERIEAGSISTSKLSADVGSSLVISGNPSITQINNQIAPEFSTSTAYSEGDLVMKDGVMYVFTQNHPAGAWNASHVSATNVSTQIELLPDQIIQYVGQQGYTKTYVSFTDPKDDPNNTVTTGDYWVVPSTPKTWQQMKSMTWNAAKDRTWGVYYGCSEVYCLDGNNNWIKVYDTAQISEAFSQITQTQDKIEQEVYRANAAEGELYSKITQYASEIRMYVDDTKYGKVSGITITADGVDISGSQYVKIASGGYLQVQTGNFAIDTNSDTYVIWAGASTGANAPFSVKKDGTLKSSSGTIGGWTITSSSLYNGTDSGTSTTQGIFLGATSGVRIVGSDNMHIVNISSSDARVIIKSGMTGLDDTTNTTGMYFDSANGITLGGGKFKVTSAGAISATSGTVGGWTLGTRSIYNGTNAINSNTPGLYLSIDGVRFVGDENHVFYFRKETTTEKGRVIIKSGMSSVNDTTNDGMYIDSHNGIALGAGKFKVTLAGAITATSGNIAGWSIGTDALYKGSGSSAVYLNADTTTTDTKDYAIWVGGDLPTGNSAAPFRVKRDGSVYLTKLVAVGEGGTESDVNLRTAGLWKLSYSTVKSHTSNSITLSNGDVINFTDASSLAVGTDGAGNVYVTRSGSVVSGTYKAVAVAVGAGERTWTGGVTKIPIRATLAGTPIVTSNVSFTDTQGSGLAYDAGFAAVGFSSTGSWASGSRTITLTNTKTTTVSMPATASWAGSAFIDSDTVSVKCTVGGKQYTTTLSR